MARTFIGVPTLNRPQLVKLTVDSVRAQTDGNWLLVVSDNVSEPAAQAEVAQWIESLGDPRVRFEAAGDRILLEVDPASPEVRALLGSCYRRFADDSRRCIDESMAEASRGRHGVPAMASITHLTLDEAEARELIGLFKPIDAFVARVTEKHDRDPSGTPRRCNYHLALHVAPVVTERLPPARMTFAEKGAADRVAAEFEKRASRLLSPRERTVAELLVRGKTIKSVAGELGVSPSTVNTLCERLYRKLGITKRAQLAMKLHALGEG